MSDAPVQADVYYHCPEKPRGVVIIDLTEVDIDYDRQVFVDCEVCGEKHRLKVV